MISSTGSPHRKDYKIQCIECGKEVNTSKPNRKFCSQKCANLFHRKKNNEIQWKHLPSGTIGTIQELRVGVDLLIKGWEVFRALSPSCSCDLLALKNGNIIRVEVRTGYKFPNRITYTLKNIKADCLAMALQKEIIYIPELSSFDTEKVI